MANFKPIFKNSAEADIPIEDGQFIASAALGERGVYVDYDGERYLITGEGTAVTVNGILQASLAFAADPQMQLSGLADRLSNVESRKTYTYGADAWSGSAAPYTMTIAASVHGKGAYPQWQFGDNQHFCGAADASGNITIESNVKKAFTITIY